MIENKDYFNIVEKIANLSYLNFDKLKNKKILITGSTGLICSFLIDVLMYRNKYFNDNIIIYAITRNKEKFLKRFKDYKTEEIEDNNGANLIYIIQDVCSKLDFNVQFDYIIHGASNTHPVQYANDPVGTILTNVIGLNNLLNYGIKKKFTRLFLMSSVEVYGENSGNLDEYSEKDLGYIDCNTMRAGYPESKRLCESLCQAFINKYDMNIVIGRFSRVFGPTMQSDDSKALAQFLKNIVNNEDIVLKSEGNQYYSYSFVADAVSALLVILFNGENGEAYNISSKEFDITLKDLANILAKINNKKVVFEIPSENERKGYSTATKAIMNSNKLKEIGWMPSYDIEAALNETVKILKALN